MRVRKTHFLLLATVLFAATVLAQQPQHLFFRVTLDPQATAPASGRLLVFLAPGTGAKEVDMNQFQPSAVYVAAKEVPYLKPGEAVDIDTGDLAFPAAFSSAKPGDYQAQAVLDVNHSYSYGGRSEDDLISDVVTLKTWTPGEGSEPSFVLTNKVPARQAPKLPLTPEILKAAEEHTQPADFTSPLLTKFSGRETHIRAWVILPPTYTERPKDKFPTVYWTHGFGGNLFYARIQGQMLYARMAQGKMPPMIWVMLDESLATGTHEFSDSVNNGPWGAALTTEFIPWIESKSRV